MDVIPNRNIVFDGGARIHDHIGPEPGIRIHGRVRKHDACFAKRRGSSDDCARMAHGWQCESQPRH